MLKMLQFKMRPNKELLTKEHYNRYSNLSVLFEDSVDRIIDESKLKYRREKKVSHSVRNIRTNTISA